MSRIKGTAYGAVTKYRLNVSGSTENVDSATDTDVWGGADNGVATALWVPPTEARVHAIVSSSTDDDGDPAGSGAHTVLVSGLDENWDEISETVTLNGTSAVNTTNSYIRINSMEVTAAGSGGVNAGTIKATAATDSTVSCVITIGKGKSLQAIYSVPRNQYVLLNDFYYSMRKGTGTGVNADVLLYIRKNADTSTPCWLVEEEIGAYLDSIAHGREVFDPPIEIPGKSDIKISVEGCSANDTAFTAGFDGERILEDAVQPN